MNSIAEGLRKTIEQLGHQPKRANAKSGWLAVFPNKWRGLVERAKAEGREGPSLVVYRTSTKAARDHWVIPYAVLEPILTDATAPPRPHGRPRWEITLADHKLKVTHRDGTIDVEGYYRAPLPGEDDAIPPEVFTPTADADELQSRVAKLTHANLARPNGAAVPSKVAAKGTFVYERRADVKAWVLQQAKGRCERCGAKAPFKNAEGEPFLELHHVRQLAHGGADTVENAVALCPNCHRRMHHGPSADADRRQLYKRVARLVRPEADPVPAPAE